MTYFKKLLLKSVVILSAIIISASSLVCFAEAGGIPQVKTGGMTTHAIKSDGTLWGWGRNDTGQVGVGNNDPTYYNTPIQVGSGNDWAFVAPGWLHTAAIKKDGTLWVWGMNQYGQLGQGNTSPAICYPIPVGTDNHWVSVAVGYRHTVALKSDGTLWAWGWNIQGELGDGTTTNRYSPTQIGTDTKWAAIAAGYFHTVALKSDGTLWAWGYNYYGQLGDGTTTNKYSPTPIGTDNDWASISTSAASCHTLALKSNGTLWAWGRNYQGQLGDGSTTDRNSPVLITTSDYCNDHAWVSISAGNDFSLGLKSDGTLWAWGYNIHGQLGDGTTIDKSSPEQIGSDSNWVSIAAGAEHSACMKTDRVYWGWGPCYISGNSSDPYDIYCVLNSPTAILSLLVN